MIFMMRCCIPWCAALCLSACSSAAGRSADQQAEMQNQGTQLQGIQLQGTQLQGMTMLGFQFAGATRNGAALTNVRVEKGELVAEQDQVTLRGADLIDAHLHAQVHDLGASPPTTATVEYRITNVEAEGSGYDPTGTGSTYLYTLEQNVGNSGDWQLACSADADGRHVAIPLAATWNEHGDRVESSSLFTFGCTTGVIAKCYRWGYRPWVTGYGDLATVHWTCTRLARADYCGNGVSHTHDGTLINVWDNLPSPGPIQQQGQTPMWMVFEAGWDTGGAVCLSHARWLLEGPVIALGCPDRLIAPGLGVSNATVCDTTAQVLGQDANATMFNESDLNANLDDL
jgi:hypothetical protein